MRGKGSFFTLSAVVFLVLFGGLFFLSGNPGNEEAEETAARVREEIRRGMTAERAPSEDIDSIHLRDKKMLYTRDEDGSVVTMYLTVSRGNKSENTDHSWEEINTYSAYDYEDMGVERYRAAALLQIGDETGPLEGEPGYGERTPNASVQIRGQTSTKNAQKNYKIELKKNRGLWRGQRIICLNKHQEDGLRFRNKLAYDLIEEIPQLVGLRTQFVHLYVKDSTGAEQGGFQDYGLYTQVEQLNQAALEAHGLDKNGHLYKINFFEFYRYEDAIRQESAPGFDLKAFEKYLEIKGNRDHTKLIRMLEDVNDVSLPIGEILDRHFDRENLQWWLAFQILIGNEDTQNRNVYLYSPVNSRRWYLLPWDHDVMLRKREMKVRNMDKRGSWETGISNYWGNMLFQRCLKSREFREELKGVMKQMLEFLSRERIQSKAEVYKKTVKPYLFRMPDEMNRRLTEEQFENIANTLWKEVKENYKLYRKSLKKPMPFYIGAPELTEQGLRVSWDSAFDLDAERVSYTVELSKDYLFQEILIRKEGILFPEQILEAPEPGQYFLRIRAENTSGETQDAFDYYISGNQKYYGIKCFYIMEDGTVEEDVYEE